MLPVPTTPPPDVTAKRNRCPQRRYQGLTLKLWLRPRQCRIEHRDMGVRHIIHGRECLRKKLPLGIELDMNLNSDGELPFFYMLIRRFAKLFGLAIAGKLACLRVFFKLFSKGDGWGWRSGGCSAFRVEGSCLTAQEARAARGKMVAAWLTCKRSSSWKVGVQYCPWGSFCHSSESPDLELRFPPRAPKSPAERGQPLLRLLYEGVRFKSTSTIPNAVISSL